jgi:hypothetical protein
MLNYQRVLFKHIDLHFEKGRHQTCQLSRLLWYLNSWPHKNIAIPQAMANLQVINMMTCHCPIPYVKLPEGMSQKLLLNILLHPLQSHV